MIAVFELFKALSAVCPIQGVSIGDPADKKTWRIDFDPSATKQQRSAAQALIPTWIYVDVVEADPIAQLQAQVVALSTQVATLATASTPPATQPPQLG